MKKIQVLIFFLFLYLLSTGFSNAFHFTCYGTKIRLPELIFPFLALSWAITFKDQISKIIKPGVLEYSMLAYTASVFLSAGIHSEGSTWLEAFALLYLYGVALIYKSSLAHLPHPTDWFWKAMVAVGVMAALSGVIGYILHFCNIPNTLVAWSDCYYGYFGEWLRAVGFMVTPNMLHNFLCVCLLLYVPGYLNHPKRNIFHHSILITLLIAIVLTFSKTILLLGAAFLFMPHSRAIPKPIRIGRILAGSLLFIICMTGTHFLVEHKEDFTEHLSMEQGCYESEILLESEPFVIRLTNYSTNKIAAIRAGLDQFPFGVGPGNFNAYVGQLKTLGLYPNYFINFDPHCTYTGAFGEVGVLGFVTLLWLVFQISRYLVKIAHSHHPNSRQIHSSLTGCFLFLGMEALVLDTLHLQYIWVLLGVLSFLVVRLNHDDSA